MSVVFVIPGMLALYLWVEERERRAANPGSPGWWERVRQRGRVWRWAILGVGLWFGMSAYFKEDTLRVCMEGGVSLIATLFGWLHEATRLLPREGSHAKFSSGN